MRFNKTTIIWPAVLMLLCLGYGCDFPEKANQTASTTEKQQAADSIILIIDYAADHADTLSNIVLVIDSTTVLDLLQKITARDSITIQTTEYPFGVMVEQIGDCRNGEGGYWLYTVNSESIPAAASAHPVCSGDTIRFFFAE